MNAMSVQQGTLDALGIGAAAAGASTLGQNATAGIALFVIAAFCLAFKYAVKPAEAEKP